MMSVHFLKANYFMLIRPENAGEFLFYLSKPIDVEYVGQWRKSSMNPVMHAEIINEVAQQVALHFNNFIYCY